MATVTGLTNPELFPIYYERKLLQFVRQNLPVLNYGQKFMMPLNSGRQAVFTRFQPLPIASTPITFQPTPAGTPITDQQVTVQIDEYGNYIALDEFTDITSFTPIMDAAIELLAYNAQQSLHTVAMNVLTAGTNVLYAGGQTSRSALTGSYPLTKQNIIQAANLLMDANIPTFPDGYYVCFIHPDKIMNLFTSEELIYLSMTKRGPIEKGYLGEFAGVKFIVTTAMPIVPNGNSTTPANVYQTLVVGFNGYGLVDLDGNTVQTVYTNIDALGRVKNVGWRAYFGCARLYEPAIVRIESN